MASSGAFEEISTITEKGQTTVPKAVRKALGISYGGKIAFRVAGGKVAVFNPATEHRDPALGAFLKLIEKDIASGKHVRALPRSVTSALRKALKQSPADLDAPLEGDVEL